MLKYCELMILMLAFCNLQVVAEEGWISSLEDAKKIAKENSRDILVDFTGSDWCGWCIKLHEEVFSTPKWKEEAPKKYVLLVVDFPREKELSQDQQKYNQNLATEFNVDGYPTIFLLDADGKPYGKTGYREGGPEQYLTQLQELAGHKEQRDKLLGESKAASGEQALKILSKLADLLDEWEVGFAYSDIKENIILTDAENQQGLKVKYAMQLAQYYLDKKSDKAATYLEIVKKYDPIQAKNMDIEARIEPILEKYFTSGDWKLGLEEMEKLIALGPTGKTAQKIHYFAAVANIRLGNKEVCLKYLELAVQSAPDTREAQYIKNVANKLKMMLEETKSEEKEKAKPDPKDSKEEK